MKNFIRFQSNCNALEKQMKSLTDLQNKVKEEVDSAYTQIIEWLREVQQFTLEVAHTARIVNNGWFFNFKENCRLSRETARMFKEVERILKAGNLTSQMVGLNYLAKTVEHIPRPSIESQSTASKTLAKIMNLLNDDNVLRIGVWGIGGVGKTTLDPSTNSREIEFKGANGEIVDILAIQLHERLQQVHKYLLILDDVWEAIDLDCIDIPQPKTNADSKIILTSCSQEVCRDMKTDEEVKLETVNDEAWKLFSRNVGEVSELVNCWLAKGLLDEQQSYDGLHNRGIALIENLMDSCLLEGGDREGTVKMHDVVGDVAIWISSSMKDGYRSLVRSGTGLALISEAKMSESLKRVSFMNNRLRKLPDLRIHCPQTFTLLLQGNLSLKIIPDGFLQAFQSLRILNISEACILSLPQSILQLIDLRMLVLKDCVYLDDLTQISNLNKLLVLDCSTTNITKLPGRMENLSNLRQLSLSRTNKLKSIKCCIISQLVCLEVLDMTRSAYIWSVKQESKNGQGTFEELQCLQHLHVLSIRLEGIPSLHYEDLFWICRLRQFQFYTGATAKSLPIKREERSVILRDIDLSLK
ncbi:disease resistance protein At4g27190-like [Pistacia vera]|uniref:disease resistance protein At4g27190-like n=1 Tax=Pistacia vera TaxID=55513 RepID=UPI001262DE12|nr:disease resistance protein At4g27190-like [Pistacia vera]